MQLNKLHFLLAAGVLAGAAPRASAETILTPYAGIVFGNDVRDEHGVYGGNLMFTGSVFGFEVDFGYSPDFFQGQLVDLPDNNVSTLMGNFVFGGRVGGNSRLYASAGGGLIKQRVDDANDFFDVDRNDFGVDAGAGFILGFSEHVGIRGDVRYFRSIGDDEADNEFDIDFGDFSFWRATGGLSFTF
ncbi:MAG TPA: outer membrane beta-barrel protein [Vicinamibacteria bacterium]|nr:outer membrane beta-barrel protein [Vicinamibacteria bacterium]